MELDLFLKAFAETGDRITNAIDGLIETKPIFKPVGSTITAAGGTDYAIIDQRPQAGRIWNILSVAVFGADDHTSVGGASCVFYSSGAPNPATGVPPLIDAITSPLAVPTTYWFSRQVAWCNSQEQLFALIYGGAAQATFSITATVAEYPVEAVEGLRI